MGAAPVSAAEIAQMREMRTAGMSAKAIAAALGRSLQQVYYHSASVETPLRQLKAERAAAGLLHHQTLCECGRPKRRSAKMCQACYLASVQDAPKPPAAPKLPKAYPPKLPKPSADVNPTCLHHWHMPPAPVNGVFPSVCEKCGEHRDLPLPRLLKRTAPGINLAPWPRAERVLA